MNATRRAWAWHGVQGAQIDALWAAVWPLLEPAVIRDEGRYDEASVRDAIRCGDMQLWMAGALGDKHKLAVTTELRVYPRQKWCNIKYVGGSGLPLAFDFLGTIEAWARAQGCVGIEGWGRPEWGRLLSKQGYVERGRSYQRRFPNA